jgi:hypothetical protein
MLEAVLRANLRAVPCATVDDARHCVRFACECVRHALDTEGVAIGADLRNALVLAERWARGENVPHDDLYEAWTIAGNLLEASITVTATAARWAALWTIEAAVQGSSADVDAASLERVAEATQYAARHARLAEQGRPLETLEYQRSLFDAMWPGKGFSRKSSQLVGCDA